MMWIMIGACLFEMDCAMPSPDTPFLTRETCLVAANVRHDEHPGSVYYCVPQNQTERERSRALHRLSLQGAQPRM